MTLLRDFALGIDGFMSAFRFVLKRGMGWMFLVPLLLWALLSWGLFAFLEGPVNDVAVWVARALTLPVPEEADGLWVQLKALLNGAWEMLVAVLLKLAIAYLLYLTSKYIILILLSPLLAYASERTEELLTGRAFPFSWGRFWRDALRGAGVAARNGVLEILISIVLWLLTLFVPVSAPFTVLLLFLVSAYFYGFSMFDYLFERRRMRIGESARAVNDRLGAVLANGMLFGLVMKVPVLGLLFAPVMAAVGAVITEVKRGSRSG